MFRRPLDSASVVAKLKEVEAAFHADPGSFIEATEELKKDDFRLIGEIIQIYCIADYCGRRVIDSIREAALGPQARNAGGLQDAQVLSKLKEAGQMLWYMSMKDAIIRAADILMMHSEIRHNFAHWAARKVRKQNVIVILSKNHIEGKRRHGLAGDPSNSNYGFLYVPALDEEVRKMREHIGNLSLAAYELENRIDEMRETFNERGMHPLKGTKSPNT